MRQDQRVLTKDSSRDRHVEHALECDARPVFVVVGDGDPVNHMPFGEVFHGPAEVWRVDPEHGGALADGGRQEIDVLVRLAVLETVHEIQLGADAPDRPRRRRRHGPDDEFGRAGQVGQVDDILMALRVHDNLDARILLFEITHVRRPPIE